MKMGFETPPLPVSAEKPVDQDGALERSEMADEFWDSIKETVQQDLERIFDFAKLRARGYDEGAIEEAREKALHREREFSTKVLSTAQEAREQNPDETVMLFDVDETIGLPQVTAPNTIRTILRPSLIPILEKLKSLGIEKNGFITSRSKEAVTQQLNDEINLAPIRDYIDQRLIYSSRGIESTESSEFEKSLSKDLGGENGIVDSAMLKSTQSGEHPTAIGDQTKLILLKKIRNEVRDKSIVVVDDFQYPRFLNSKNKLYGVSLADGGAFHRPFF